jgi:hypothetical protein
MSSRVALKRICLIRYRWAVSFDVRGQFFILNTIHEYMGRIRDFPLGIKRPEPEVNHLFKISSEVEKG